MGTKAAPFVHRGIFEVERKFLSDCGTKDRISRNQGNPAFRDLRYLGKWSFEDQYFDHHGLLCANNIWLRTRDLCWVAKIRQGGNRINSQFKEISSTTDIAKLVQQYCPSANVSLPNFGLQGIAQFKTVREAWRADDRFEIVLDSTDFGHSVGEVELQESVISSDDESLKSSYDAKGKAMDQEIETFMQRYSWAFPVGEPVGKLTAYFARKSETGGRHPEN